MSLTEMTATDESTEHEIHPYRAVSKAAIASLILGALSIGGLLLAPLLALAAIGFLLGLYALRSIRRFPDELTGKIPAVLGTFVCGALLVGGIGLHSVIYATEVPEGYLRTSFAELQPVSSHPELPVSPAALEMDGQRIFVKGYLYPDGQQSNIKRFVLIPDMGTCCFGGQPKLTDMIEVTLEDPLRTEFARRKRKLGGVLTVDMKLKPVSGLTGVYYQLKADYIK